MQIEPVRIGAGQFGCPICSKFMKNQRDMKRHIMVHTGEKPFTCNYCDFACNFQGSLNRHIKNRHTNVINIEKREEPKNIAETLKIFHFANKMFLSSFFAE